MKSLSDVQQAWLEALWPEAQSKSSGTDLKQQLKTTNLSAEQGIKIYHNSLEASLLNHLEEAYAVTKAFVGEDFLRALCKRYIATHPSITISVADYGADLAEFIAEFEHTAALYYLQDLAKADWATHACFYAPDCEDFPLDAFAELDDNARLAVKLMANPSLTVIRSDYPIYDMIKLSDDKSATIDTIALDNNPQNIIIWRQGFDTHCEPLTDAQAFWCECLLSEPNWEALCAAFLEQFDEEALTSCLINSADKQWIHDFKPTNIRKDI